MKNIKYKNFFDFLWKETKKYRLRIILFEVFVFMCWGIVPVFIQPAIFASFLNAIVDKTLTINYSIFLAFLYSLFFISTEIFRASFVERYLWYGGILRAKVKLMKVMFNYSIDHSVSYFSNKMSGVIMEKIRKVEDNFEKICDDGGELITYILVPIISIIVYIKINLYISLILLGYMAVFLPIYYVYLNVISQKRKELTIEEANSNGLINDTITNIQNVKAFSNKRYEEKKLKKQDIKILMKLNNLFVKESTFNIIFSIINITFIFAIFATAFYFTFKKEMSIGTFVFINQNIAFLRMSIYKIIDYSKTTTEAIADSVESYNTIFEKHEIKDKENAGELKIDGGRIVFRNITFRY